MKLYRITVAGKDGEMLVSQVVVIAETQEQAMLALGQKQPHLTLSDAKYIFVESISAAGSYK